MSDNPSFSSMFRRGRFSRSERVEQDDEKLKNDRKEDFAVAAVAFVLKHDEKFKLHFLVSICGVQETEVNDYEILLHPHDFDLVLLNEKQNSVIVFEFKVDAGLDSHQKYFGQDFFRTSLPQGYGYQINQKHFSKCSSRKYIVVQKREKYEQKQIGEKIEGTLIKGIQCYTRSWIDLFLEDYKEPSKLLADLEESLEFSFDITELKSKFLMKKDLANSAQQSIEIYQLLKCAASEYGDKSAEPTVGKGENGYDFGIDIKRKTPDLFQFLQANQDINNRFIWFGYEPFAGRELSVWVCALRGEMAKKAILEKIPKSEIYSVDSQADPGSLVIYRANKCSGDLEWFIQVLRMLAYMK